MSVEHFANCAYFDVERNPSNPFSIRLMTRRPHDTEPKGDVGDVRTGGAALRATAEGGVAAPSAAA